MPSCDGLTPLPCAVTLTKWPAAIVIVLTDEAGNVSPRVRLAIQR